MAAAAPLTPPDSLHCDAAEGWLLLGNLPEARAELTHLAHHAEHPDVLEVWWRILAADRHWLDALHCAEKLVAVAPARVMGWINQSYALHELKQSREAFERLRPVVEKFRDHYVIPYNLACYQCQLGDKEEALLWLRRAVLAADAATIRTMALDDPDLAPLRTEVLRLAKPG